MQVLLRSYGTHQVSDILIDPDAGIRSARQTRCASTQHRVAGERVWMATTDRGVEFGPKVGVCEELTVSRRFRPTPAGARNEWRTRPTTSPGSLGPCRGCTSVVQENITNNCDDFDN